MLLRCRGRTDFAIDEFIAMIFHWPAGALVIGASRRPEELGYAHEIVGEQSEDENGPNLGQAADLDLSQAARCLDPAEHFLNALAAALTDGIAGMAQGALVDGGLTPLAGLGQMAVDGDVGRDVALASSSSSSRSCGQAILW